MFGVRVRVRARAAQAKGEVGFTRYNFVAICCAVWLELTWAYPILFCTSVGVLCSFHTSQLLDETAFHRMRVSEEVSHAVFHVVNLALHVLPAVVTGCLVWSVGVNVTPLHGYGLFVCFIASRLDARRVRR